jgi:hypothetical protein
MDAMGYSPTSPVSRLGSCSPIGALSRKLGRQDVDFLNSGRLREQLGGFCH